jgi:hypothetical protein
MAWFLYTGAHERKALAASLSASRSELDDLHLKFAKLEDGRRDLRCVSKSFGDCFLLSRECYSANLQALFLRNAVVRSSNNMRRHRANSGMYAKSSVYRRAPTKVFSVSSLFFSSLPWCLFP